MKKILLSLSVIAIVGVIAVGATRALFSDTETSTGNTFTAGTIDISIDQTNPWTKSYNIGDLKPGETGYINFDISNVGTNPVNVSKNLSEFVTTTGSVGYTCAGVTAGVSSEPECVAAQANSSNDVNDVQTKIIYDLSVEVYNSAGTKIWWQAIYTGAENKSLADIYGSGQYVALGMIPAGGHMKVTQSYHFNSNAGNEYQGDTLSFKMTINGEQLPQGETGITTVALENKVQGTNSIWDIVQGDSIDGTLSYKVQSPTFDYTFTGKVAATDNYTLIYVGTTNDYPGVGSKVLGTGSFVAGTPLTISGSVNIGASITNGKVWLIPTSSYNGSIMTSWPASNILFETGLINYTKI